jgi:hypothetical protein
MQVKSPIKEEETESPRTALLHQQQLEIHNLRKLNASLRTDKSKLKASLDTLQAEIESLKAANKKLEALRLREREYSCRLEVELDKHQRGLKKSKQY